MGQATWELTRKFVHPEIEGAENFAIVREHLKNGGTALLYSNDPLKKREIPAIGIAVEDNLTSIDHFAGFVSRHQVDKDLELPKGLPNRIQHYLLMDKWAKTPGVKMIRVVQPKHRNLYPDWEEFNAVASDEAKAFLKTPGNVFGITPEGTRSATGLIEAQPGVAMLFRDARDIALAMPLGIHHDTSKITVGRPFSWTELVEDHKLNPGIKPTDRMMVRLALLLPEKQRGFYTQMAKDFILPQAA